MISSEQASGENHPDPPNDWRRDVVTYYLERQNATQSYNADMSKWILGSLILANGGPFLVISKDVPDYLNHLRGSVIYFIMGISLAILCGFSAWLNTGMREANMGYKVKRFVGYDIGEGTTGRGERLTQVAVNTSYILSLLSGFGSLAMFFVGAFLLSNTYLSIAIHPTTASSLFNVRCPSPAAINQVCYAVLGHAS